MAPTIRSLLQGGTDPLAAIERLFIQGEGVDEGEQLQQRLPDRQPGAGGRRPARGAARASGSRASSNSGAMRSPMRAGARAGKRLPRAAVLRPRPAALALLALFEGAMTTSLRLQGFAPGACAPFAVAYLRAFTTKASPSGAPPAASPDRCPPGPPGPCASQGPWPPLATLLCSATSWARVDRRAGAKTTSTRASAILVSGPPWRGQTTSRAL